MPQLQQHAAQHAMCYQEVSVSCYKRNGRKCWIVLDDGAWLHRMYDAALLLLRHYILALVR